jgi:hypothetical protein
MAQVTESDYRAAQQGDARVRQEFLDAVDLEDAREFVSEINYTSSAFNEKGITFMSFNSKELCFLRSGPVIITPPFIEIHPESFDYLTCQGFLSCLIDHEGYHARQDVKKPEGIREIDEILRGLPHHRYQKSSYFESLLELPAYANQIMRAEKRELTWDEKLDLSIDYAFHELVLKNARIRKNKKRDFKKDLSKILCDTDGDNLIRQHFGIN